MRVTVQGIEAFKYEQRLRELGLVSDPDFAEEILIHGSSGRVEKRPSLKTVLTAPFGFGEYCHVFVGYPGELCVTIHGDPAFIQHILTVLGVPVKEFCEKMDYL